MLLHRKRRATPPESKSGPPLRGRSQKTAELRRLLARSPATRLRCTPRQRISKSDHDVQMWSNVGLSANAHCSASQVYVSSGLYYSGAEERRWGMVSIKTNTVLAKLRAGQQVACVWLSLGSEAFAEIAAEAAPDAVVLDAQHGLWDVRSTHAALGMIACGATPLVRVADNSAISIGLALDAGAQGIIVPLIESAEQAAKAVSAAHYPPKGERSGGGVRPLADFPAYWKSSSENTLVSVMIETRLGLENVAAIAAVPGIDMIFIGTGDLTLSLGFDADIEAAIQTIFVACREANVPCGIFTVNAQAARARLSQGFAFVVAETDLRLAREGIAASLTLTRSGDTL